jgi:hypothetical protein
VVITLVKYILLYANSFANETNLEGMKMKEIIDRVNKLKLGKPQIHQNLVLVPLFAKSSKLEYLIFDEAVNEGLKIGETGSVQSLHFSNKTGNEILIMQGEYVKGGKQNRMVATNIYMAQGFDGEVPVNCVEQHRWTGGPIKAFESSGEFAPRGVSYLAAVGQHEVWNAVRTRSVAHGVKSRTADLGDIYTAKRSELADYLANFHYVSGSVGILGVTENHGKKSYSVDIFDQSKTIEKNFRKLVESLALDAEIQDTVKMPSKDEVASFLKTIESCHFSERKPVSLGRDFRLNGGKTEGFALTYEGIPLYITLSSSTKAMGKESWLPDNDWPDGFDRVVGPGDFRFRNSDFETGHYRHRGPTDSLITGFRRTR